MKDIIFNRSPRFPENKYRSKVLFCSHPDDAKLRDEIEKDITSAFECDIWYHDEPTEEYNEENYLHDLYSMHLIVVPVTTKLLTKPSFAMEKILPYALQGEKHIAVLPLMQENGIEDVYAKSIFDDLQFLNKFDTDPTALPYKEKLKKYLEGVLTDGETVKKIQDAFDAYIFMSYRKKDRAFAQRLMETIHKNPKLRNVAIWYDEYLVPGESFNKTIASALDKSKLFALVVTPNLLEDNYIQREEYPMAKNKNKPIIPVEMEKTFQLLLKRKYKNLPWTLSIKNEKKISEAILDNINAIALAQNDADPEHNFFIALAYLYGIDVEKNAEYAEKMLSFASEKGYVEATRKLSDILQTGDGVKRDYEKAAKYQRVLAEQLKRIYEREKTEKTAEDYINALWESGDRYNAIGKPDISLKIFSEMLKSSEELSRKFNTGYLNRSVSVSYNKLGDIYDKKGQLDTALGYYEKGLELSEALADETETAESRRDLSVSYNNLGDIYDKKGQLDTALGYYEKGLQLFEALARETETVGSRRDLSISYNRLGDIYDKKGQLDTALGYHEKGLELSEALADETKTVESRRDLSVSYNKLGYIYEQKGQLDTALGYYEKGLQLFEVLARETETVESRRDLSISYNKLGDIYDKKGQLDTALGYYEKCLELRKALARETKTVQSCSDLSISYNNLGNIYKSKGQLDTALGYYEKCLELRKALARETETVQSRRDLSISYERLGNIYESKGQLDTALEYYKKYCELSEALARETETVESRRDLSISYNKLGDIYDKKGQLDTALGYYEKCLQLFEALARETETVRSRRDLSVSYERLGGIYKSKGQLDTALRYYEKGLELCEALARETKTVQAYDGLALSYFKLATVKEPYNTDLLKQAYDIYCRLCEACPGVQRYEKSRNIINIINGMIE